MTTKTHLSLVLAATLAAACQQEGPAGPAGPTGPAAGRLRAVTGAGDDLGFVYGIEWISFATTTTPPTGAGTWSQRFAIVKQQPDGAVGPVLVFRTIATGAALPCTEAFAAPGCAGTGTAVFGDSTLGTACVAADGHAHVPDLFADPQLVTFQSRRMPFWSVPDRAFGWFCAPVSGSESARVGTDVGLLPAVTSRINVAPAD